MYAATSIIHRALQLRLQSTGGLTSALFNCLDTRAFGHAMHHIACKISSNQARNAILSYNEEADRQWVAFIATTKLWTYLKEEYSKGIEIFKHRRLAQNKLEQQ